MTWDTRAPSLHNNPLRAVYMRCVRVHVRVSAFSLINGLYYSELLNFISSGSLWGIEQALSPSACTRVFTYPESATLTYLQVNMLYGCIFVVQAPCWVAKLQREQVGIRAPPPPFHSDRKVIITTRSLSAGNVDMTKNKASGHGSFQRLQPNTTRPQKLLPWTVFINHILAF